MVGRAINEFRKENGKCALSYDNYKVNGYCLSHSLAMAGREELYHADPWLCEGWSEAVACCSAEGDWGRTEHSLVFDILGTSEKHRNILLNSNELAYGLIFENGLVYLTVRGRT